MAKARDEREARPPDDAAADAAAVAAGQVRPADLDPVVHERVRLAILAVLAARKQVDYLELRGLLDVTDGNLATHVRTLEGAGLVAVTKALEGKTTRTTYRITPAGRAALERHVAALEALLRPGKRRKRSP